jgi:hypothetical protein
LKKNKEIRNKEIRNKEIRNKKKKKTNMQPKEIISHFCGLIDQRKKRIAKVLNETDVHANALKTPPKVNENPIYAQYPLSFIVAFVYSSIQSILSNPTKAPKAKGLHNIKVETQTKTIRIPG